MAVAGDSTLLVDLGNGRLTRLGPELEFGEMQSIAFVLPDGSVVVARSQDYGVDWYAPDGTVTRGDTVEYEPVPITLAEKAEYFRDRSRHAGIGMVLSSNSDGSMNASFAGFALHILDEDGEPLKQLDEIPTKGRGSLTPAESSHRFLDVAPDGSCPPRPACGGCIWTGRGGCG